MRCTRALVLSALALTAPVSAATADVPAPGYALASAPNPAFGAALLTLPDGGLVTWDGVAVERWLPDGTFVATLTTFSPEVFESFVVAAPGGDSVVIGNSSNGRLHEVFLDGSGRRSVARLDFNFDAAYGPDGGLYVSAATCGFQCGNRIVRVDVASGATERVATVAGPSGPLAFDAAGNLVYATQADFPAPPDSTDVIRWTPAQLATGGGMLTELDAEVVAPDFDAGSSLACDPVTGRLYLGANDFLNGVHGVFRIEGDGDASPVVVQAANPIGALQLLTGGGAGSFDPYQPAGGVALRYTTTDFVALSDFVTVDPARPVLAITGPGTTGPGPFTLTLTGAEPGGGATIVYAPQSGFDPNEHTFPFPGFLLHTGLPLAQLQRLPFALAVDGTGGAAVTFQNPGGLEGAFAWQLWIRDATGALIGTSSSDVF